MYSFNAVAIWSGQDVCLKPQVIPDSFEITSSIFIPLTKDDIPFKFSFQICIIYFWINKVKFKNC